MKTSGGKLFFVDKDGDLSVYKGNKKGVAKITLPGEAGNIVSFAGDNRGSLAVLDDMGVLWVAHRSSTKHVFKSCEKLSKRVVFLSEKIVNYFLAVIDEDGKPWKVQLYAAGKFKVTKIKLPKGPESFLVKKVVLHGNDIFLESEDGLLYAKGPNKQKQLGLGDESPIEKYKLVPGPGGISGGIVSIQTNRKFSVILDEEGNLWTCGLGGGYELTGRKGNSRVFEKVEGLPPLTSFSSSLSHVICIDYEGNVFAWGSATMSFDTSHFNPEIDGFTKSTDDDPRLTGIMDANRVFAGHELSFYETQSGEVFVFGIGSSTILGLGYYDNIVTTPQKLEGVTLLSKKRKFKRGAR